MRIAPVLAACTFSFALCASVCQMIFYYQVLFCSSPSACTTAVQVSTLSTPNDRPRNQAQSARILHNATINRHRTTIENNRSNTPTTLTSLRSAAASPTRRATSPVAPPSTATRGMAWMRLGTTRHPVSTFGTCRLGRDQFFGISKPTSQVLPPRGEAFVPYMIRA